MIDYTAEPAATRHGRQGESFVVRSRSNDEGRGDSQSALMNNLWEQSNMERRGVRGGPAEEWRSGRTSGGFKCRYMETGDRPLNQEA